jgi:hypothetical protein
VEAVLIGVGGDAGNPGNRRVRGERRLRHRRRHECLDRRRLGDDLEAAATDIFMAFTTGDDQSFFDALSNACRERLGFAAVQAHLQERRFEARQLGGIDLGDLSVAASRRT